MLFNNPIFIVFFLCIVIVFYVIPLNKSWRKVYLTIVSYYYLYLVGGVVSLISLSIVGLFTYIVGIIIEKINCKRIILTIYIGVLGSILVLKNSPLINTLATGLTENVERLTLVSMVGISYYIFSAISYVVDIYVKRENADKNIIDLMLWLSFFPKIVAGPIEKHSRFKRQLKNIDEIKFDVNRIKRGLLIMAWGYFQKIVVADRIALFVNPIYGDIGNYRGIVLFIVMILYSLQIYMDFSGYSNIALGAALVLGVNITQNFKHPYFATSIGDFWRRWHISLTDWFREYVYIPLGGNRKGKVRTYINLFITFLISGMWHGAGWNYIVWGCLHGCYQILEKRYIKKSRFKKNDICRITFTFLVVSITWIFFRCSTMPRAFLFIKNMFSEFNPWILIDGTLTNMGFDLLDWYCLIIALMVVLVVEIIQHNNISIYSRLQKQPILVRWGCYYLIIIVLLIFGVYGSAYSVDSFIYFRY